MFNTQEEALIKEIYKLYKDYSGIELSTITHEEKLAPQDKEFGIMETGRK